jgi:hypothetical protein
MPLVRLSHPLIHKAVARTGLLAKPFHPARLQGASNVDRDLDVSPIHSYTSHARFVA